MTVVLLLLGLLAADQVVDDFQYAGSQAARHAWTAKDGTPEVDVLEMDGSKVLSVTAPFARKQIPRTVIDRRVEVDLAGAGEFTLELSVDDPRAVRYLNLYFRSGDGWYSSGKPLRHKGWHTLHFSKASFRVEEQPVGWNKIDGIRIAAWRGEDVDTAIRLRRLAAISHQVAVIIPSRSARADDGETRAALDVADRLSGMFAELGLGADAVEQRDLGRGALGNRRLAVLAYNPRLDDKAVHALEDFVAAGGKVLVCYAMPARLGEVLGFGRGTYVRQERPGDFAEVRFHAPDVPGLPTSVRQNSWNITTVQPIGHAARVIGRWFDDQGKPSGHAAMLLSDRGAFFSHIVLGDDREAMKQMLAAVLGRLDASLWQEMASAALAGLGNVGHCNGFDQLAAHVRRSDNRAAREALESAHRLRLAAAENCHGHEGFHRAVALARQAREQLARAYLLAQPSLQREGRAVWNHSGTGAYAGDWERSAKVLAASGFNMVLPNMLWAGRAHYASDVLPRSSTFAKYGDQVAQCVAAAGKHGVEVHVWKVNYNLSGAPPEFVARLRREGRLQVSVDGGAHEWLCPSHPQNQRLELDSMLEVARKYPVHGLHFDYIRYPSRQYCYCDGCRRRFETALGAKVARWPQNCYSGSLREQYNDWRCRQITALVEAVSRGAKQVRPGVKISAAVFGAYPDCRASIAQDWPEWVRAGLLDFVCPMDYTDSDLYFSTLVKNQLRLVDGRIPIYPGIGATASNSTLSADRVVGQIHHARTLGAAGFTIFNFHGSSAESILPGVGSGAGARPATPPHAQR